MNEEYLEYQEFFVVQFEDGSYYNIDGQCDLIHATFYERLLEAGTTAEHFSSIGVNVRLLKVKLGIIEVSEIAKINGQ